MKVNALYVVIIASLLLLTGCGPSEDEVKAAAFYEGSANMFKLLLEQLNDGTLKRETFKFAIKMHDDDLAVGMQQFPGPNWDQPSKGKAGEAYQKFLAAKKAFDEALPKKPLLD